MLLVHSISVPLQLPITDPFENWLHTMSGILNVAYAFSIRGYIMLIIIGMTLYVTGLNDLFSKFLVVGGTVISIIGPPLVLYIGSIARVEGITAENADMAWAFFLSFSDMEILRIIFILCSLVVSLCMLVGSILYFTPSSPELKTRGHSLIVRTFICVAVFLFLHMIIEW